MKTTMQQQQQQMGITIMKGTMQACTVKETGMVIWGMRRV